VKEYESEYHIHWDKRDPNQDPIGHIVADPFYWWVAIVTALATILALLSSVFGEDRRGM